MEPPIPTTIPPVAVAPTTPQPPFVTAQAMAIGAAPAPVIESDLPDHEMTAKVGAVTAEANRVTVGLPPALRRKVLDAAAAKLMDLPDRKPGD